MFNSCNPADDCDEVTPALLLRTYRFSPVRRPVRIAPTSLLRLLHPSPLDTTRLIETMEQRIKRSHVKPQRPTGPQGNQFRNVVPVSRLILEQGQHQKLRASFLPFRIGSREGHLLSYYSVPYMES